MTAPVLTGGILPGFGTTPEDAVFRTFARAHVEGLDVRSALDAALMVRAGVSEAEAVALAGQDAHDPRVKTAAQAGTALIDHVRTVRERASTGEGPAEPECWCEYVDVLAEGPLMKCADNPDCPRCHPDADRQHLPSATAGGQL